MNHCEVENHQQLLLLCPTAHRASPCRASPISQYTPTITIAHRHDHDLTPSLINPSPITVAHRTSTIAHRITTHRPSPCHVSPTPIDRPSPSSIAHRPSPSPIVHHHRRAFSITVAHRPIANLPTPATLPISLAPSFVVERPSPSPHRPSIAHRPIVNPPIVNRPIVNPPIVHRPSSIVHRPSPIVHRPSPIVHHRRPSPHRPSPIAIAHRPIDHRSSPWPHRL